MHQKQDEHGRGPSDLDRDLREQQGLLLSQIDALVSNTGANSEPKAAKIYNFKQEYNVLVQKRGILSRNARLDPMDVLPPDLWPQIVRYIVEGSQYPTNKLIDLISISNGWCSMLTSLPVIWTKIWLDQSKSDYLAKAMMCIHFSGECEIDLMIGNLTSAEWRGISPMIVLEGRRIRRLEFTTRRFEYSGTQEILEEFTKLPVLQELVLPTWPDHPSDQRHLDASITKKMPFIRMITTREVIMGHKILSPFITSCYLVSELATKKYLDTLAVLPQLRHLTIWESTNTIGETPSKVKSSFESLTSLAHQGRNICHHLTWIGSNLSLLSTELKEGGDFEAFLAAISRFPHLHELMITISAGSWWPAIENETERASASPRNSLKVLNLMVPIQKGTHGQYRANWDVLFRRFYAASPCLEVLSVYGIFITDLGWNSIQGIATLRDLTIGKCEFGESSLTTVETASLRNITWDIDLMTLVLVVAKMKSHFVQNLRLTESDFESTIPRRCIAPGSAFPNITFLAISTTTSFSWEIATLSRLRELEVRGPSDRRLIRHRVSDIWGAILMRPRDNPALEKITFLCDLIEWDILILMLERRNFLNEPAVSLIKTLVFRYNLPYRLLYPLSELLGGRFVERDSNQSFSVEALGERVCNGSITGCLRCHYSFRECESCLEAGVTGLVINEYPSPESIQSAQAYRPPYEYLIAEPPLLPDVALWLSGTRERRKTYMYMYAKYGRVLRRVLYCDFSLDQLGGSVVNGDILAGAHFADELEENDAGLEA